MSIVRILAKKRDAMRITSLIEGFPDYFLEEVLEAFKSELPRLRSFFGPKYHPPMCIPECGEKGRGFKNY
jgi:hypothetical protein